MKWAVSDDASCILVVEDDPRDRNLLVRTLGEAGYRVKVAPTGSRAIAACEAQTFEALTLDLLLPDMSGLQVLQRIRQIERSRDVPVLIVSVVAEQGVVHGFPVHDYLTKPIDPLALVRSLRLAQKRRRQGCRADHRRRTFRTTVDGDCGVVARISRRVCGQRSGGFGFRKTHAANGHSARSLDANDGWVRVPGALQSNFRLRRNSSHRMDHERSHTHRA